MKYGDDDDDDCDKLKLRPKIKVCLNLTHLMSAHNPLVIIQLLVREQHDMGKVRWLINCKFLMLRN